MFTSVSHHKYSNPHIYTVRDNPIVMNSGLTKFLDTISLVFYSVPLFDGTSEPWALEKSQTRRATKTLKIPSNREYSQELFSPPDIALQKFQAIGSQRAPRSINPMLNLIVMANRYALTSPFGTSETTNMTNLPGDFPRENLIQGPCQDYISHCPDPYH